MLQGSRISSSTRVGIEEQKKTLVTPHDKREGRLGDSILASAISMFPYNRPYGHIFQRKNSHSTLTIMANHKFGLPYASPPRLFFASIINEVKETKSPVLNIGTIYSKLICDLKVSKDSCNLDNEEYIYDQMLRLFSSHISCDYKNKDEDQFIVESPIYKSFDLWRNPLKGSKENISLSSTIVLTKDFYNELINFPLQVDFKILQANFHLPMQIDIYIWLMCQPSLLKEHTLIPWNHLINQFNPEHTVKNQGLAEFKGQLLRTVNLIMEMRNEMNIEVRDDGLILNHIDEEKT